MEPRNRSCQENTSYTQELFTISYPNRPLKLFSIGYRVALLVTGVVCLMALFIEQRHAAGQRENGPITNMVGRQRMFAERLSASIMQAADTGESDSGRKSARAVVSQTLAEWKAADGEVLNYVAREGASGIRATIASAVKFRKTLEAYARQAIAQRPFSPDQLSDLRETTAKYQHVQERVMTDVLMYADKKVGRLSTVLEVSTLVILVTLLLQGIFLFRPLLAKTRRSFEAMETNRKELESLRAELELQNGTLHSHHSALTQAIARSDDLARLSRFAAARFEELFAGLPIAAFTFDEAGLAFEWNREAESVFGIPASNALGVPFVDLIALPSDRAEFAEVVRGVFQGNHYYNVERQVSRSNGEIRLAIFNIFPLRDPDGSINGGVCSLVDVTEQRSAEERLRSSERRFRQMVEDLPTGAILVEGRSMFVNRYVEEITGYRRQELADIDTWFETMYPETAEQVQALYQHDKALGFPRPVIVPVVRKDGEIRHVEFTAYSADRSEVWLLHDVTERLASQERFRVLFEHSSDAHLLFDETGILDCNEAAVRMLGCEHKDHLLSQHPAVFSPEFQSDGRRSDEKCIEMDLLAHAEGYHRFEWIYRKMDGTDFPVEVTLTPVALAGRDTLLAVWHDLTDQKRHERQIHEANAALNQAQSIARIGSWQCDHELKNPIWSPEMYRLFGMSPDDPLPGVQELFSMIHPEDADDFKKEVFRTKRHGESWKSEYRFFRRDGEERILISTGQPVDGGRRFVGTFQDVTEARLEAKKIQESETLFRTTMEALHAGMVYMDRTGRITMINPKGAEILRLHPDQILGAEPKDPAWVMTREDGTPLRANEFPLTKAMKTRQPLENLVCGINLPDGERVWISVNAAPVILSGQSMPIGAVASFTDITELRAQHELLVSEMIKTNDQAVSLELQKMMLETANRALSELATKDGLTGLKNHRSFQEFLEQQFAIARRSQQPLSLLLLDVDKFKAFNDEFGHQAGDEVLRGVAWVLGEEARKSDFVARYGGEEFVVVLPDTDREGAITVAEKLRAAIESENWPYRQVTASFGAATLDPEMKTREKLIASADGALYESKRAGRNRVTHAQGVSRVA